MSATPTQLQIVYVSTPPSTTTTATVPIPQSLQSLNSSPDNSNLTGFNGVDVLLDGIFRRKYFYVGSTAIPTSAIVSVSWS